MWLKILRFVIKVKRESTVIFVRDDKIKLRSVDERKIGNIRKELKLQTFSNFLQYVAFDI